KHGQSGCPPRSETPGSGVGNGVLIGREFTLLVFHCGCCRLLPNLKTGGRHENGLRSHLRIIRQDHKANFSIATRFWTELSSNFHCCAAFTAASRSMGCPSVTLAPFTAPARSIVTRT